MILLLERTACNFVGHLRLQMEVEPCLRVELPFSCLLIHLGPCTASMLVRERAGNAESTCHTCTGAQNAVHTCLKPRT